MLKRNEMKRPLPVVARYGFFAVAQNDKKKQRDRDSQFVTTRK
jgi:hypothetical protein